jgi:hypothetical protein
VGGGELIGVIIFIVKKHIVMCDILFDIIHESGYIPKSSCNFLRKSNADIYRKRFCGAGGYSAGW